MTVMGFAVRVRSAGQKYGPTCHQRNRPDVTEFVTLVRLSSLGQHVDVLALAGYKRRKSALAAGPIRYIQLLVRLKCIITNYYTELTPALPVTEQMHFEIEIGMWISKERKTPHKCDSLVCPVLFQAAWAGH